MTRLTSSQWECLIRYMRNHIRFARGQYEGRSGKKNQRNSWEELTIQMNSIGHGIRSVKQWQKTWADIKYNIKKKYIIAKSECDGISGVHPTISVFNHWERKVIHLLGRSLHHDTDSGSVVSSSTSNCTGDTTLIADTKHLHEIPELLPVSSERHNPEETVTIKSEILPQHVLEHSYVPQFEPNPGSDEGKELVRQNVEILKSIKDAMVEMSASLKEIFNEMKEIKELLKEKQ